MSLIATIKLILLFTVIVSCFLSIEIFRDMNRDDKKYHLKKFLYEPYLNRAGSSRNFEILDGEIVGYIKRTPVVRFSDDSNNNNTIACMQKLPDTADLPDIRKKVNLIVFKDFSQGEVLTCNYYVTLEQYYKEQCSAFTKAENNRRKFERIIFATFIISCSFSAIIQIAFPIS